MSPTLERRRATDGSFLCRAALRASQLWDFVDKRDIDKHFVSVAVLFGTFKITAWAMSFAELAANIQGPATAAAQIAPGMEQFIVGAQPTGFEAAAVIAAVLAPYMALQAAAIAWYFRARSE